ncbi:MAG: hypothetical protein MZU97_25865 [Bacillus subtilis]|nr:hypothetical protein [Bacillus subtilis]
MSAGETITHVSLGYLHSSAITSSGRIFTWGANFYGRLGDGTTTHRSTPVEITARFNLSGGETICHVSLGNQHSAALTSTGRIFTWGRNEYGQLGDGTSTNQSTPVEITARFSLSAGETITQVSLGGDRSAALTSTGRFFTWGSNGFGRLGDGTTTNRFTPVEITSNFVLSAGETITQVSLGIDHSSALTSTGRIFTWGSNDWGQLGDGTATRTTPVEITSNFILSAGETIAKSFLVVIILQHSPQIAASSHGDGIQMASSVMAQHQANPLQ